MDRTEFENMELNDQVNYLNGFVKEGKTLEEIEAEVGMTEREMGAIGLYFIDEDDGFMGKPMRGYQTSKRSGNEYAATGKGWRSEEEAESGEGAAHVSLT